MRRAILFLAIGVLVGVGGTTAYRMLAPGAGTGRATPGAAPVVVSEGAKGAVPGAPVTGAPTREGGSAATGATPSPEGGTVESGLPVSTFAEAEVRPRRTADLAFAVSGVVSERLVEVGDEVEAGAPLLRLDSSSEQALLRQAEAALAAADAQVGVAQAAEVAARQQVAAADAGVAVAKAQLDAAEAAVKLTLHEAANAIARAEAQRAAAAAAVAQAEAAAAQARAATEQATAAVKEAQARRDQAAAARDSAALAVERRTLRAPFAGRVLAVPIEVGEAVGAAGPAAAAGASGGSEAAVRLADTSAWLVDTTNLTERQVVGVQAGRRVRVEVDALPGRTFAGEVERVGGASKLVRGDVTYVATVRILPDGAAASDLALLRSGMTAVVRDLVR
ncbi:MAG: HlyD family efflux transporter periplasmic adaptor subunit [Deinococcales bacterium]